MPSGPIDIRTALEIEQGKTFRGYDGARDVLTAAADANLRIVPVGDPEVKETEDAALVTVPAKVVLGRDEIGGTAEFEVRDNRIAAFDVARDD